MIFPINVCINFQTQVFNTYSRIQQSFTTQFYFQIIFKFFLLRFKDQYLSFFFTLSEILFAFHQLKSIIKGSRISADCQQKLLFTKHDTSGRFLLVTFLEKQNRGWQAEIRRFLENGRDCIELKTSFREIRVS